VLKVISLDDAFALSTVVIAIITIKNNQVSIQETFSKFLLLKIYSSMFRPQNRYFS